MKKVIAEKNIFLGLSLMLLLIVSCTKDEVATTVDDTDNNVEETDKNILEFISDRDDATIFEEIIKISSPEVMEVLSGDEDYTIFVPTDQAWETFFNEFLDYGSVDDLTIEKRNDLRDLIVNYHTTKGSFLTKDFNDGQEFKSLEGQPFTTLLDGDNIFLEDNLDTSFNNANEPATVIIADSTVSNGVVQIIDRVMIPKDFIQTLARKIIERDDTSIFEEALRKTDLLTFYRDITRANAFIPNDTAWETCFELLGDDFNSLDDFDTDKELELLREILLEHVTKSIGPDGFSAFTELKDLDTQLVLRDHLKNGPFGLKDATGLIAQFEESNIPAENKSVLHIIDRVLLPKVVVDYVLENYKDSLMDFIMKLDDCKSLHDAFAAVSKDVLPSFLKNGTPFTLLLPSREALTAFEKKYNDLDTQKGREILANVIGYHFIFGQKIASSDIAFMEPYVTFQRETLSFQQTDGGINVIDFQGNQGATVLSADNDISGGTVHVIDNVLLPMELDYYKNE